MKKKPLYFCIAILLFFRCVNVPEREDTHIQIDRHLLMQDVCIMDTVWRNNLKIIFRNPYKNKGSLKLKGSMHGHTNNSHDSWISPYAAAIKFRDEGGFDFFTFTDHNYVTLDPGVPGIVWMGNAVEDTKDGPHAQHLVVYNLPTGYQFRNRSDNIHELIDYYHSLGAFVSLAHPDWSAQFIPDGKILSIERIDFVEIVRAAVAQVPTQRGAQERAFDLLLSQGVEVFGFGVDDFHYNRNWEYPNRRFNKAFIIAFAERKERASIWRALLSGSFYAATHDARMNISCTDGVITVSSDRPSTFEFIGLNTENPGSGLVLRTYTDVKEATYTIQGDEGYVRLRMTNSGGVALSQPFMILSVTENSLQEDR